MRSGTSQWEILLLYLLTISLGKMHSSPAHSSSTVHILFMFFPTCMHVSAVTHLFLAHLQTHLSLLTCFRWTVLLTQTPVLVSGSQVTQLWRSSDTDETPPPTMGLALQVQSTQANRVVHLTPVYLLCMCWCVFRWDLPLHEEADWSRLSSSKDWGRPAELHQPLWCQCHRSVSDVLLLLHVTCSDVTYLLLWHLAPGFEAQCSVLCVVTC